MGRGDDIIDRGEHRSQRVMGDFESERRDAYMDVAPKDLLNTSVQSKIVWTQFKHADNVVSMIKEQEDEVVSGGGSSSGEEGETREERKRRKKIKKRAKKKRKGMELMHTINKIQSTDFELHPMHGKKNAESHLRTCYKGTTVSGDQRSWGEYSYEVYKNAFLNLVIFCGQAHVTIRDRVFIRFFPGSETDGPGVSYIHARVHPDHDTPVIIGNQSFFEAVEDVAIMLVGRDSIWPISRKDPVTGSVLPLSKDIIPGDSSVTSSNKSWESSNVDEEGDLGGGETSASRKGVRFNSSVVEVPHNHTSRSDPVSMPGNGRTTTTPSSSSSPTPTMSSSSLWEGIGKVAKEMNNLRRIVTSPPSPGEDSRGKINRAYELRIKWAMVVADKASSSRSSSSSSSRADVARRIWLLGRVMVAMSPIYDAALCTLYVMATNNNNSNSGSSNQRVMFPNPQIMCWERPTCAHHRTRTSILRLLLTNPCVPPTYVHPSKSRKGSKARSKRGRVGGGGGETGYEIREEEEKDNGRNNENHHNNKDRPDRYHRRDEEFDSITSIRPVSGIGPYMPPTYSVDDLIDTDNMSRSEPGPVRDPVIRSSSSSSHHGQNHNNGNNYDRGGGDIEWWRR
jgi:hypothetical protein